MCIFGCGSPMGDGWERKFGCLRRYVATLTQAATGQHVYRSNWKADSQDLRGQIKGEVDFERLEPIGCACWLYRVGPRSKRASSNWRR